MLGISELNSGDSKEKKLVVSVLKGFISQISYGIEQQVRDCAVIPWALAGKFL